ncbi:N-acetylglutaminylglutamine synthetase [Hyphobacterium sp. Y6023]|uniref:N-acetylglutaminylglutamine synthetase n=1 Tax=Hyphobacterium marinum TaxID=3116574 RepID=A0ABU7LUU4_9PROT|nr:N-acetylglutaminylglutamine synthetase [Hyphobacterium sp. Y6023]MEE2565334.1 N-acetylglutaminylglutamine synthetase [Hyphobacterium sp. Y6023]
MRDTSGREPVKRRDPGAEPLREQAVVDCGWGRLVFAQTFPDNESIAGELRGEGQSRRDIAFYIRDPHVLLALAPQELFLDPSHTYRLSLTEKRAAPERPSGFVIRRLASEADAEAVNRIYAACNMVTVDPGFLWTKRDSRQMTIFVAEDVRTGDVIGSVTGVDHARAFNDPQKGSSLWCLAIDPRARRPRIGESLTLHLADHFRARGAAFMDLSVLHDNEGAIALYERLGFKRIPFFSIKRKNPINERLFTGPAPEAELNIYARIITDEARRRGVHVEVLDAESGFFRLSHGGRTIVCRESLSELTTAVAMSLCDDKSATRRLLAGAGLPVPEAVDAEDETAVKALLDRSGAVVVKPARGEQGRGVTVGVSTPDEVSGAVAEARKLCPDVIVEEVAEGEDLRVIVIGGEVVAAALRRRPSILGDGKTTIRKLTEGLSRRRVAASDGESAIPLDAETERCIAAAGYGFDDILPKDEILEVRRTANLHTGGTLHDVTAELGPAIAEASLKAAETIGIPVVGLDFMAPDPASDDFVLIEANERPGLANHEPQPTAERFVDLLFPQTARTDTTETTSK